MMLYTSAWCVYEPDVGCCKRTRQQPAFQNLRFLVGTSRLEFLEKEINEIFHFVPFETNNNDSHNGSPAMV